jgi:hypothetical protein
MSYRSVPFAISDEDLGQLLGGRQLHNGDNLSPEGFEYTWEWFRGLAHFYEEAARAHRRVIFTVDL